MCQRSVQQRGTVLVTQLMPLLQTSVYPRLHIVYFDLGRGPDEWHTPRGAFSIRTHAASSEPTMWKLTASYYSALFQTAFTGGLWWQNFIFIITPPSSELWSKRLRLPLFVFFFLKLLAFKNVTVEPQRGQPVRGTQRPPRASLCF